MKVYADSTKNSPLLSLTQHNLSALGLRGMIIFLMASTKMSSKISDKAVMFHLPCWLMRLETIKGCVGFEASLGEGLKPSSHGTHGSYHTSMDLPYPTKKQTPLVINSLALSMDFQIREALLIGPLLSHPLLTLYLLLRALIQRLFSSCHHPSKFCN